MYGLTSSSYKGHNCQKGKNAVASSVHHIWAITAEKDDILGLSYAVLVTQVSRIWDYLRAIVICVKDDRWRKWSLKLRALRLPDQACQLGKQDDPL